MDKAYAGFSCLHTPSGKGKYSSSGAELNDARQCSMPPVSALGDLGMWLTGSVGYGTSESKWQPEIHDQEKNGQGGCGMCWAGSQLLLDHMKAVSGHWVGVAGL